MLSNDHAVLVQQIKRLKNLSNEYDLLQDDPIGETLSSSNIKNKDKIVRDMQEIIDSIDETKIKSPDPTSIEEKNPIIILNARGDKLKVLKRIIERSKVIAKELEEKKETEYYIDHDYSVVNNLLNYLKGKPYKNPQLIDEMIIEYDITLDDAKIEERKQINDLFEECKEYKIGSYYRMNFGSMLRYYVPLKEHQKHWNVILAKKLLEYNKFCDRYEIDNDGTINIYVNKQKFKEFEKDEDNRKRR